MGLEIVMLSHTILFVENEGTYRYHIFFSLSPVFPYMHVCALLSVMFLVWMDLLLQLLLFLFKKIVIFTKQILQFVCEDQETRQTLKTWSLDYLPMLALDLKQSRQVSSGSTPWHVHPWRSNTLIWIIKNWYLTIPLLELIMGKIIFK